MSERLLKMVSELYAGLRSLEDAVREEPEPTPVEQPNRFKHTDDHGDVLTVVPSPSPNGRVLTAETYGDREIHIDQDAVNRLAQYLDRYRTDQPKAVAAPVELPREHWCGRNVDHGEHVHARDSEAMYCLGSHEGVYGAKP